MGAFICHEKSRNEYSEQLIQFNEINKEITINHDILQHILNPYLHLDTDIPTIQSAINIIFNVTPHFVYEKIPENKSSGEIMRTYKEGTLIKLEKWYKLGKNKKHRKKMETNFLNDLKQGYQYFWYRNGVIKTRFKYVNDLLEGWQYQYYDNGSKLSMIKYQNGVLKKSIFYDKDFYYDSDLQLLDLINEKIKKI
jgi:hypothetical protein